MRWVCGAGFEFQALRYRVQGVDFRGQVVGVSVFSFRFPVLVFEFRLLVRKFRVHASRIRLEISGSSG